MRKLLLLLVVAQACLVLTKGAFEVFFNQNEG